MNSTENGRIESDDKCIDEDGRVWYWDDEQGWV